MPKKSKKSPKSLSLALFRDVFGLFRHFFGTPGRQARDDLFETFFGILGPEGLALPVTGRYNRKPIHFRALSVCPLICGSGAHRGSVHA